MPRVQKGLKLADSRLVQHLHNLARALTRPQDELAWAALLRGPWARNPWNPGRVAETPGRLWPEKLRDFAGTDALSGRFGGLITTSWRA